MENNINGLEMMSKDELIDLLQKMMNGGVSLSFNGKRTAQVIQRKVMPRVVKINKKCKRLNFRHGYKNPRPHFCNRSTLIIHI